MPKKCSKYMVQTEVPSGSNHYWLQVYQDSGKIPDGGKTAGHRQGPGSWVVRELCPSTASLPCQEGTQRVQNSSLGKWSLTGHMSCPLRSWEPVHRGEMRVLSEGTAWEGGRGPLRKSSKSHLLPYTAWLPRCPKTSL